MFVAGSEKNLCQATVLWLNVCLATCALHPMCFHPRCESSRTHTHKWAQKNTRRIRLLTNARSFSVSHTHTNTHTQMNSMEAWQGVWLGQKWTHAGIRAAVCDSHFSLPLSLSLSLSFFQSLASFFRLSLTPHSHLSLLCLPPCAFEKLSVSNVFCTQTHQRTVLEPIEAIRYFLIEICWFFTHSENAFCLDPTLPSFLLFFFFFFSCS